MKNERGFLLPAATDQLRRVGGRVRRHQNRNSAATDSPGPVAASAVAYGRPAGSEAFVGRAAFAQVVADDVGWSVGHDPGA